MPSWLLFILPLVLLVGVHGDAVVTFDNRAGVDVDVYWRDVERSRWALLTSVPGGMTGGLNTFKVSSSHHRRPDSSSFPDL